MFPRIDGMHNEEIEFHGHDIDKIDGIGSKIVRSSNGQDLIIHNKIDGSGVHKLIGFGFVEVRDKVDGSGDRWFIDCGRVVINDRKDGMGNLYLVNTPCNIAKKSGSGNVIWCGVPPTIESKGLLNMGEVIEDGSLISVSEGQGRVKVDKDIVKGPGAQSHQDEYPTQGKVHLDLGEHRLGSGPEFERKIRIDQGPTGGESGSGRGLDKTGSQGPLLFKEGGRTDIGDTSDRPEMNRGDSGLVDRRGENLDTGASDSTQRSSFQGRDDLGSGHSGKDDLGINQQRGGIQNEDRQQVRDSSDMRDVPFGFQKKGNDSPSMGDKIGGVADNLKGGMEQMMGKQNRDTHKQDDLSTRQYKDRESGVSVPRDDKKQVRDSSEMRDVPFGFERENVDRQREEDRQGANIKQFDRRNLDTEQHGQQDLGTGGDSNRDRNLGKESRGGVSHLERGRGGVTDRDRSGGDQGRGENFDHQQSHWGEDTGMGFDRSRNQQDLTQFGGSEQDQSRRGDFDRDRSHQDKGLGQSEQGQGGDFDRDRSHQDKGLGQSEQGQGGDFDRNRSHQDKGLGQSEQGQGGDFDRDRRDHGESVCQDFDRDRNLQEQNKGDRNKREQSGGGATDRERERGRDDLQRHGFHDDKHQKGRDDLDLGGTDTRKGRGDEEHNDEECESGVCKVHHPQQTEQKGDEPRLGRPPEEVHKKDDEKEGTGLMEKVTGLMNRLF
ncbi:hypothetical protein EON65_11705 [archaeon]|nr:MAG: hypothetical protein EON65_11705 [archaeon]